MTMQHRPFSPANECNGGEAKNAAPDARPGAGAGVGGRRNISVSTTSPEGGRRGIPQVHAVGSPLLDGVAGASSRQCTLGKCKRRLCRSVPAASPTRSLAPSGVFFSADCAVAPVFVIRELYETI